MKVYYLSTTSFADCDVNLLHHLPKKYEVTYGVLIPRKNANYSKEQLTDYCTENNIKNDLFCLKYRYRDPRSLLTYIDIIKSIIHTKPDLILINNFDQIYFNVLSFLLSKKKTVIAIHDVISHSGTPFNKLTALSRSILIKNFNQFLTFSASQADLLKNLASSKKIHTIPLALKSFGQIEATERNKKSINFLFFGNIKSYKGLDILLKSVNRLSKKYASFTLTVAGRCTDWNERYEDLLDQENKHILDKHVRFIENEEIPSFFGNADYLVLPYRDATQSGPLMIAFNYNVPIIASNIDGFKEFIEDGVTGYLFDNHSDESIDKVLEDAILRKKEDYEVLRFNALKYKNQHLTIENTVKAYDDLFISVINN